ncbi:Signal recognition particle subunit SRP72 [Elasticomyces elasticus]|nr:Signal recognition particle subunit SRP72 [Elasticomyces elasticus]
MSSSVPTLVSLLKRSHIDDHEEVLKVALKHGKTDLTAQHAKVVALLKLDRFDDAVHAFELDGLKEKARLEYAYALYKTGKAREAAEVAKQGTERGCRHVEAQASYRTEDFEQAAELYRDLAAADHEEDAEVDLRINASAVDAQLEWAGQGELVLKKKPDREDLEAFETAYNAACGSLARGDLGQGGVLLKRARDLCAGLEDLGEEERRVELVPIVVQLVYVLARQGKMAEAEALVRGVEVARIGDVNTRHIAQVNRMAASAGGNPFLAQRLLAKGNSASSTPNDQPFHFQTSIHDSNQYAVDLQTLKFAGTADATASVLAKHASRPPTQNAGYNAISIGNAAAHAKNQEPKTALPLVLPLLQRRPRDFGLVLTVVQLYVEARSLGSAIAVMEKFLEKLLSASGDAEDEAGDGEDVRFAPGLVGVMVSLYHHAGRKSDARRVLGKAGRHWLKRKRTKERRSDDDEDRKLAGEIFANLHDEDDGDAYATAGLLAASPDTATGAQRGALQPVEKVIAGIDVDSLETAGIAHPPTTSTFTTTSRKRPADDPAKPTKPKRPRPSRLPKALLEPGKLPDPERWLPLRDRSSYKPAKGKKGKGRDSKGRDMFSQGSAAAVVGGEGEGSRPVTPGGGVVVGKGGTGGGGGRKKGKR